MLENWQFTNAFFQADSELARSGRIARKKPLSDGRQTLRKRAQFASCFPANYLADLARPAKDSVVVAFAGELFPVHVGDQ
ncbi:hypothetical protein GCM10023155_22060 [Bremerella cremea]